ncbi:hypothetical protein, partial [Sphingobacterium sp. HMA12]|uniref:hypothetical protein n=1 Tax=Sphingobacterium sp. HMA12 TaxID=2050894 RepID=UPI001F32BCFE
RWESRSVPFFTRKPLLETVKGFFRLYPFYRASLVQQGYRLRGKSGDSGPEQRPRNQSVPTETFN